MEVLAYYDRNRYTVSQKAEKRHSICGTNVQPQKKTDLCELECPAEEKLPVLFAERREIVSFLNLSLGSDLQAWSIPHTLKKSLTQ